MSADQPPPAASYCLRCGTSLVLRQTDDRERRVCPACGWTHYPKPSPASAVAIVQDGQVLMVRRRHEPFKGHWTLPSGFLEYGETPEQAAVREVREEIGVDVELTGLVDVLLERGDPRGLCLLVVYTGRVLGGRLRAGDDAAEVRAFPLDHPPEKIAFLAHRQALEKVRAISTFDGGSRRASPPRSTP